MELKDLRAQFTKARQRVERARLEVSAAAQRRLGKRALAERLEEQQAALGELALARIEVLTYYAQALDGRGAPTDWTLAVGYPATGGGARILVCDTLLCWVECDILGQAVGYPEPAIFNLHQCLAGDGSRCWQVIVQRPLSGGGYSFFSIDRVLARLAGSYTSGKAFDPFPVTL